MQIRELARTTGVAAKTIRYYETIGLLPRPARGKNNYREYTTEAVWRLRFVASARSLGFGTADIGEFLKARASQKLPCHHVMNSLDQRIAQVDRHIADLMELRASLENIRQNSKALPRARRDDECVCDLFVTEKPHRAKPIPKSGAKK